jgi:hypothetical protein
MLACKTGCGLARVKIAVRDPRVHARLPYLIRGTQPVLVLKFGELISAQRPELFAFARNVPNNIAGSRHKPLHAPRAGCRKARPQGACCTRHDGCGSPCQTLLKHAEGVLTRFVIRSLVKDCSPGTFQVRTAAPQPTQTASSALATVGWASLACRKSLLVLAAST